MSDPVRPAPPGELLADGYASVQPVDVHGPDADEPHAVLFIRVQTILQTGFHLVFADWLTVVCFVGLVAAALLGSYFVQTAYSTGSRSVVVAGLTVIDPMVGPTIASSPPGEAAAAPWWAAIIFALASLEQSQGLTARTAAQESATPSERRRPAQRPSGHVRGSGLIECVAPERSGQLRRFGARPFLNTRNGERDPSSAAA